VLRALDAMSEGTRHAFMQLAVAVVPADDGGEPPR